MSVKKERPILFSTPMVQAILNGTKTQTRRIVKDKILQENNGKTDEEFLLLTMPNCPYGKVGDILWVRETWFSTRFDSKDLLDAGITSHLRFKADENYDPKKDCVGRSWKPSIHMPKSAARIFLEITEIKVERLLDISEEDAGAEGIEKLGSKDGINLYKDYLDPNTFYSYSIGSFSTLWVKINGLESWNSNPWVWVVKFKVIKP